MQQGGQAANGSTHHVQTQDSKVSEASALGAGTEVTPPSSSAPPSFMGAVFERHPALNTYHTCLTCTHILT